jgi:cytochrome bd-type quinol oxidase subunit 2
MVIGGSMTAVVLLGVAIGVVVGVPTSQKESMAEKKS